MLLTVAWKGVEIMSGIQKIPRGEEVRNGVGDETWSRYKILHYTQRRRGWGKKTEFKIGKTGYRERRQSLQTPVFQQSLESPLGVVPGRVGIGAPVHLTTHLAPGYFLSFFSKSTELVTILLLFYALFFWLRGIWDLRFQVRD